MMTRNDEERSRTSFAVATVDRERRLRREIRHNYTMMDMRRSLATGDETISMDSESGRQTGLSIDT